MTETVLLIAEWPSRWDNWVATWCTPERQLVLLVQAPHESLNALCDRVERCCDQLSAAHCRLTQVTIARANRASGVTTRRLHQQLVALVQRKISELSSGIRLQVVADTEPSEGLARAAR